MNKITKTLTVFILLNGCATYTNWEPVVDTYNDPNANKIPQDTKECKILASHAGSVGTESAKGMLAGGLLGAAAGAAIGAVTGSPGSGAAIGAAAGGIGGGTYAGVTGDNSYKTTYITCMRNRGHNVIN